MRRPPARTILIALLALTGLGAELLTYTGPDRTILQNTTVCKVILYKCEYKPKKKDWAWRQSGSWSCSNEAKPWLSYHNSTGKCHQADEGATKYEKHEVVSGQVPLVQPPAEVYGVISCEVPGNAGWCRNGAWLGLSSSEPLNGFEIYAIEGTQNGENMICMDDACSVPLVEGQNDFTFWALSTWGDTSLMGTAGGLLDSAAPGISVDQTGSAGSNGWYMSPVIVDAYAFDPTSGLASLSCTVDGAAEPSCTSLAINDDGSHSLEVSAFDVAGNEGRSTQAISIDTHPPSLNAFLNGTTGSNGWYTSATLNAAAADPVPGSGLDSLQAALDGGPWADFSGSLSIPDGIHTIDTRALDAAGWETRAAQIHAKVDSLPPELDLDLTGTPGLEGWLLSLASLSASASDSTSGMGLLEYRLDGGSWIPYSTSLSIADGEHRVDFWAEDKAGHVVQETQLVKVDTRPPKISGSLSGVPGANGWYVSNVMVTAGATDPLPGSGIAGLSYTLDELPAAALTGPLALTEGRHTLTISAADTAGRSISQSQEILVDTTPPVAQFTNPPADWIMDTVILRGTGLDATSGLSRFEISTDNSTTWQTLPGAGTSPWSYAWDTRSARNGASIVRVRVTDNAGLAGTASFTAFVDNLGPEIELPGSWFVWETVRLDASDAGSGMDKVRLVIHDPQNRWPNRRYEFAPGHMPVDFKWDRRFEDGTVAPWGNYEVTVTAIDRLGHATEQEAVIRISLDVILPPPPTSTPLSTPLPATVTPTATIQPTDQPPSTPTAGEIVSTWGTIEPTPGLTPTPTGEPLPRATPTTTTFAEWIENIIFPQEPPNATTSEIWQPGEPASAPLPVEANPVLFGAAAVGALGAYLAEKKREEREAAAAARQAEERHRPPADVRERQLEKQLGSNEYRAEKQAEKLKKDIAKVVAEEERKWKEERIEKIETEMGYNSLKGVEQQQFVKQRLEEIRQEEAEWREKKRGEAAEAAEMAREADAAGRDAAASQNAYAAAWLGIDTYTIVPKVDPSWQDPDLTEAERLVQHKNSDEYQEYRKKLATWEEEKKAEEKPGLWEQFSQNILQPAGNWINENIVQPVKHTVTTVVETVREATANAVEAAKEATLAAVENIQTATALLVNTVKKTAAEFADKIREGEPTGSIKLASLVPAEKADPGPLEWIKDKWEDAVKWWNSIWEQKPDDLNSTPTLSPTESAIHTQVAQTIYSQLTATAMNGTPTPFSTPTFVPTMTPTAISGIREMWVNYPANLRSIPSLENNTPITTLTLNTVVIWNGITETYNDPNNPGNSMVFSNVNANGQSGWIYSNFLNEISTDSTPLIADPNKKVDIQPEYQIPNNAEQYLRIGLSSPNPKVELISPNQQINYPGVPVKDLYNLCGEFSAAYITGKPIITLISDWVNQDSQDNRANAQKLIGLQGTKTETYFDADGKVQIKEVAENGTTGIGDLQNMLDLYHCSHQDFSETLNDPVARTQLITPTRLKEKIDEGNVLIAGVKIDGNGSVNPNGAIPHWVVVDNIKPIGVNSGSVQLYNPFHNQQEIYNYETFIKAFAGFTGNAKDLLPYTIRGTGIWVNVESCK